MQLPEIPVGVETDQNELYRDTPSNLRFNNVTVEDDRKLGIKATSDQATDSGFVNRISRIGPASFSSFSSGSNKLAISSSGRYVPFLPDGNNLFVYDRQTDSITSRIFYSGGQSFAQSGGLSDPSVSADGRYIAYRIYSVGRAGSIAFQGTTQILVYDRDTNTTITVYSSFSTKPYDRGPIRPLIPPTAFQPLISADGQSVVYASGNIFVYDLQTKTTTPISRGLEGTQTNGSSNAPSISALGQYIAYQSDASNLVVDDTNNTGDIFVHDRHTGITRRISVSSNSIEANDSSSAPSISADGRYVAFSSNASNLVSDDTNNTGDIFVHDRVIGITKRISVSSDGIEANDSSGDPSISADGRYVVFQSNASNLVADDTNNTGDIFVHDRHTGITRRISIDLEGTQANGKSSFPSISADGSYIAFLSSADNLVLNDTNRNGTDIFIYDFLPNVINGTQSQTRL